MAQNYMQRRNSFGHLTASPRSSFGHAASPRNSFGHAASPRNSFGHAASPRNSFSKYTASPSASARNSFSKSSSSAGSEAAKHSEGMRLAVASALATVLPDVIAAEALGEGRRLGARETAAMAASPHMMYATQGSSPKLVDLRQLCYSHI